MPCGAQVSRQPPPSLPGGYTVGEQVYYTGTSQTVENGDRLEHGKQGEVVGAATSESHKGKGVAVRFPGNMGKINCYLDQVAAAAAATQPPTASRPPQLPLLLAHPRCVARGRNR